jgi:hypothetical protein
MIPGVAEAEAVLVFNAAARILARVAEVQVRVAPIIILCQD